MTEGNAGMRGWPVPIVQQAVAQGEPEFRPTSRGKIIYRIIDDLIFVSDIFDTRQDPEKMVW
ncbi:MAG: hypothetical protein QM724_13095 [Flavobacteriales bacterium]